MSRFHEYEGSLTFEIHSDDLHCGRLDVTLALKGRDPVTIKSFTEIYATKDHGISFSPLGSPEKSISLSSAGFNGDMEIFVGDDGLFFADLRPKGGKWVPIAQGIGDGLYHIVQTADGLGFVRSNNQPEYWPPTTKLTLPFKFTYLATPRTFPTDPRKRLPETQHGATQFEMHPLPKKAK